ncbi:hypothetical protein KHA90_16005 [Flavobacterium psychroterrae]|uniref:LPS export ABC transporter periplasmic protein LptC n=1 Tax=Flavobacterium psychroterrae TaxID=2133767 RepID=A0ABS5PE11_9FLAO|nr:hypothetical protein [Flavobacterium psychroterrae]MBS7232522.1 hypothetical protein [Flavobacterium psychroterrae]
MKNIMLLSFLICLFSCKKEENKNIKKKQEDNYSINVDFPDTVYVSKYYNGKINYKNELDTITTKLLDINKPRFLEYGFTLTRNITYNETHLKKIETDTMIAENNRMIPLYSIRFKQLGVNYIDGMVTDEVNIENGGKNEKGEPMTRVITNEFRVTKKVIVIEKKEKK